MQATPFIGSCRARLGDMIAVLMTMLCGMTLQAAEPSADRPNIILCMSDDQGWGDTGYNGHPVLQTPHLDQMAREGLRFDRFYAAAPVCSPTRGSCLTGRHPSRYGISFANTGHIRDDEFTLAERLQKLGYQTGHFGKWHLGTLTTKITDANRGRPGATAHYAPPWEHGFDACFSTESKVPTFWKPGDYESYGTHYWTGPDACVPATDIQGDDSALVMDRAIDFIRRSVAENDPFFSVIWFHAPHLPVVAGPEHRALYTEHQDYYGCITALDEQVGRLRTTLDEMGVATNTMLWFCADNGPEGNASDPGLTRGLRGRKRSLYEGGVRVPGLLVWPAVITTPRTVSMPCCTSDYLPTILEVVGQSEPAVEAAPLDGISLVDLIHGRMTERPSPIAFASRSQQTLVDNRYKIYSDDNGASFELFDLIADPAESSNLAQQHPEIVRKMRETLAAWHTSCLNDAP
jgi:arylsulfatase A-like enzyme